TLSLIKACLIGLCHNHSGLILKNLSLGGRFAAIAVFSTLLTVVLIAITAYRELVADFESVLTQRQQLETANYASSVNQRLQLRLGSLAALAAQMTDGETLVPSSELTRILNRQSRLAQYFDLGLVLCDADGVARAGTLSAEGRLGTSYGDRARSKDAMATVDPDIRHAALGRTPATLLASFLYATRNDPGQLVGLAGGSINLASA